MKNFEKLKQRLPNLANMLETMTKEEILEHYAVEVEEKSELMKYKADNEFFENDLEHIINLGAKWLKKNKKDKHQIVIKSNKSKLVYKNTESKFI